MEDDGVLFEKTQTNIHRLFNETKKRIRLGLPTWGTCAGAILMSSNSNDSRVKSLKILDIESDRNAWGAQVDSFSDYVDLEENDILTKRYYATFIRGPKFLNVNKSGFIANTLLSLIYKYI